MQDHGDCKPGSTLLRLGLLCRVVKNAALGCLSSRAILATAFAVTITAATTSSSSTSAVSSIEALSLAGAVALTLSVALSTSLSRSLWEGGIKGSCQFLLVDAESRSTVGALLRVVILLNAKPFGAFSTLLCLLISSSRRKTDGVGLFGLSRCLCCFSGLLFCGLLSLCGLNRCCFGGGGLSNGFKSGSSGGWGGNGSRCSRSFVVAVTDLVFLVLS
ncbi:hypothetical protein HG530_000164 [Fusarium avenaceum]|nr:hypothetical protein HG530_000164 [Fusarium avenaceum]